MASPSSQQHQHQHPAGSAGSSHPLRPYYQPTETQPIFVATSQNKPHSAASASSSRNGSSKSTAASSSARSAHAPSSNRYTTHDDDDLAGIELGSVAALAKASVLSLALQYSSTCIAMPFEVGKLLLQVQWVPKDEVWSAFAASISDATPTRSTRSRTNRAGLSHSHAHRPAQRSPFAPSTDNAEGDEVEDEEESDMAPEAQEWRQAAEHDDDDAEDEEDSLDDEDLSSTSDVEAYFRDVSNSSSRPSARPTRRGKEPVTDAAGYLVRRSLQEGAEAGPRPEFVMPVVVRGGVWEMMKAVARGKEGWAGLWKGTFTTFLYDLLASGVQPVVSAVISPLIPLSLSTLPLPYVPHPKRTLTLLVSSHVITHIILSPLDLIRTRLVVQSTLPRHRKYSGPWDALKKILKEEGGWRTAYAHPHLIVPALLDVTIRPFLSLASPLLIERCFHADPNTSPVAYALAELVINTSSLLVSLPIETVRRRLQIQRRAPWGKKVTVQHGSRASSQATTGSPRKARAGKEKEESTSAEHNADTGVSAGLRGALFGFGAHSSSTMMSKGLRTCVETRPRPYTGVVEAIYRILTEETAYHSAHHGSASAHHHTGEKGTHRRHARSETEDSSAPDAHPMARSEILAPSRPTYATLGGLKSLYRGFTMAAGANLVVFLLTVVTGERVSSSGMGGGAGGGGGGMGGWAEI